MTTLLFLIYLVFTLVILYHGMSALSWEIGSAIYLLLATFWIGMNWVFGVLIWLAIILVVILLHVESLRDAISDFLFERVGKSIPKLSKTEEEALNAGDSWFEKDIFIGSPDWDRLMNVSSELSAEEQAFLDNEVQTLCGMLD